jgi:hypothetical protein
MKGEMERQPTSEASATPQRLSGLSYDEALAILDKGQGSQAPVRPSAPGRTWRGGRVALVALTVVAVTAGVGLLGQASHRVLDCPAAPSPWRPDCAAVRTADAPVSPGRRARLSEPPSIRRDSGRCRYAWRRTGREHAKKAVGGRPRDDQGAGRRRGFRPGRHAVDVRR